MPHSPVARPGAPNLTIGRPATVVRAGTTVTRWSPDANGTLLNIGTERVGRRTVLSVAGELDISNAADLRMAIENAASGAREIWLDLSATTFMDSSGLHAMAEARARVTQANLRLALICPEGPVLRVLALAGFDRSFEIHASRSAANHATLA